MNLGRAMSSSDRQFWGEHLVLALFQGRKMSRKWFLSTCAWYVKIFSDFPSISRRIFAIWLQGSVKINICVRTGTKKFGGFGSGGRRDALKLAQARKEKQEKIKQQAGAVETAPGEDGKPAKKERVSKWGAKAGGGADWWTLHLIDLVTASCCRRKKLFTEKHCAINQFGRNSVEQFEGQCARTS